MRICCDRNNTLGLRPALEGYQNNTLRYSPPADFPAHYASRVGTPKIMRSSITLDEVWDYRTGEYFWDYAIGVNRYEGDPDHAPYDWPSTRPAPSGITFCDYLKTHSEACDEMIFFYRRYEREVVNGVISMEAYEEMLEKVIEYYKNLCPNLVWLEQNEPNCEVFGNLNAFEYYQFYRIMYRIANRLNVKHRYERPLKCVGPCIAFTAQQMPYYRQFLRLYKADPCPDKRLDAYAAHEYAPDIDLLRRYYNAHQEILRELELPELPIFFDEFGMMHPTNKPLDNLVNTSGVLEALFDAASMPNLYVFPWCSFHNPELQRSLTQFVQDGRGGYEATPHGIATQLLHMLPTQQVAVSGDCGRRAFAATDGQSLYVMATNYTAEAEDVVITAEGFSGNALRVTEYRCDEEHNYRFSGQPVDRPEVTGEETCAVQDGRAAVSTQLKPYSFALWILAPQE